MYAERDTSLSDHLSATSRMLPCLISAGHHKYGMCAVMYLEEIIKLPDVAPKVDTLSAGSFIVKQTDGKIQLHLD